MITRLLDEQGNVVHDCVAEGCANSWDGYSIETGEPLEGRAERLPGNVTDNGDGTATIRRGVVSALGE